MYRHLLVATDGSKLSDKAVSAAVRLAAALQARLTIFHARPVWLPTAYPEGLLIGGYGVVGHEEFDRDSKARAEKLLARASKPAVAAGVQHQLVQAAQLHAYEAILDCARKQRCDCIVMASHGRRGLPALLLGSETQKVLTHSKLPVLVVR